ncbi:MAG: Stk1 family PASTA domain-containing Ser/Thr kinase [Ruminiclostridium sp.]|nr:Stk1 family PASTA domain-containing Ser/Thr kinase [Ruminiclostridium sp.]
MTGKVLNNRYELAERIGYGGMAEVYKARCRVLKRWVAVKILKDEFVNDEEFLERFEREAFAAGSLNHPNIVSIYDVGREDNIHYIVMEYVDGITLKDYIQQNGALPWEEAADIAISILSALHKAHRHNIIHRDIKPQNIIMTSDNVPKVADFGIARAATTTTATRKVDTVGSVHYASPEQARGGYTDEKSDLYSVGVTLFEMVTGRVPFNADNPVTVALKHIEEEPSVPSDFVPGIPGAMDGIILRAMKKSKTERYDSALQMIAELDHLKKGEALDREPVSQTDAFDTRVIGSLEDENLSGNKKPTKKKKDKPKKVMIATYIMLIGVILGGLWLIYDVVVKDLLTLYFEPKLSPVEVISYEGWNVEEAIADLTLKNLPYAEPEYEYNSKVEKGKIISQKPSAGISILPGGMTKVELVVSSGMQEVVIPEDIKFGEYLDVEILLRDELKLKPREVAEYSDEVAQGRVIRTDPAMGTTVQVGTEVIIYKSLGPNFLDVVVPDLTGRTMDEAKNILLEKNLSIGRIFPEDRDGYKGTIINQVPRAGDTIKELSPVNIYFRDDEDVAAGDGIGFSNVVVPGDGHISENIVLPEGITFGDDIHLVVYAYPGSTGEEKLLANVNLKRSGFPRAVQVPVSAGHITTLKVYMDGKLQYQKDIIGKQ